MNKLLRKQQVFNLIKTNNLFNNYITTNKIINNNINNNIINNHNNKFSLIKKHYTSTSNIFNCLNLQKSDFDNLKSIKINQPIPDDISSIQKKIFNLNENDLSPDDRLNYANYLIFVEMRSNTFHKYNIDMLNKIWSLLDLNNIKLSEELKSTIFFINAQFTIAFSSKVLIPRVSSTIQLYIDTFKKIQESDTPIFGNDTIQRLHPITYSALLIASHLGMWKEMVYLHSILAHDKYPYLSLKYSSDQFAHPFNYYHIYQMITNKDQLLNFNNPIFDLTNQSIRISESKFNQFSVYDTLEEGFQGFRKSIIGQLPYKEEDDQILNSFTSRVLKEFDGLERKGRKNSNGYIVSYAPSSFTILGSAISMDIHHLIIGGIIQDFKKTQLYAEFNDPTNPEIQVQYQYDLNIINNSNDNNNKDRITLKGTHKIIETFKNNSKIMLDSDVVLQLKKRELLNQNNN